MAPPAKKCKIDQGSLWSHEDRMLGEKFFYLNKSTTKYAIVGLDHRTIRPIVKLCDRATGRYISIKHSALESFASVLSAIITGSYTLTYGHIDNIDPLLEDLKFASMGNCIWRIASAHDKASSLQIHISSLKNLVRIMDVIRCQIGLYNCDVFATMIDNLKLQIKDMPDDEIDAFLLKELKQPQNGFAEHQVLSDLICYRDMFAR